MRAGEKKRIVILGGGFGGAYAAKASSKIRSLRDCEVVILDRNNYLLFYPLLVEAGVGSIEARHVVVPIRKFLNQEIFQMAEVCEIDVEGQHVKYRLGGSDPVSTLHYDHLVIGLGSVTRIPEIPGLEQYAFSIKTLDDAIGLRDRGIRLLELANSIRDSPARRELLTCITVGANYTGVEFAGEYHSFLLQASRSYPNIKESDIRMIVIEYADQILGGATPRLAEWCLRTLQKRGIEIATGTTLTDVERTRVTTSKGELIHTRTVVWAAGIAPNPLLIQTPGLPINKHGYIECEQDLSVKGFDNVWAIGDAATVLDSDGNAFSATAQTASRQGPHVMKNIAARLEREGTSRFDYTNLGAFAAIGRKQAAANALGYQFTGFTGWLMYRATYLIKMPSLGMKVRLLADWLTEIVFRNEPVQLGVHRFRDSPGESL